MLSYHAIAVSISVGYHFRMFLIQYGHDDFERCTYYGFAHFSELFIFHSMLAVTGANWMVLVQITLSRF